MNVTNLPFSRAVVRHDPRRFSNQFAVIGNCASGKTDLSKRLAAASPKPLVHLSAGGLMREIAKKAGQSITDFAKHLHDHPEEGPDEFVDSRVRQHMSQNWSSLDAHLPVFSPHAFIIYLKCPWRVCAERRAIQKNEPASQVLAQLMERDRADQEKYAKIYPGSQWVETDFDCVVDTECNNQERTFELVWKAHAKWSQDHADNIVTGDVMPSLAEV